MYKRPESPNSHSLNSVAQYLGHPVLKIQSIALSQTSLIPFQLGEIDVLLAVQAKLDPGVLWEDLLHRNIHSTRKKKLDFSLTCGRHFLQIRQELVKVGILV